MNKNCKNRLYVDVHVLQTLPPSCVNRDDTGSPKTAIYGGTVRARVSSQSWKHAMREKFKEIYKAEDIGIRTKRVPELVAKEIMKQHPDISENEAKKKAKAILKKAKLDAKETDDKLDTLFFISRGQIREIARLDEVKDADTKLYQKALKENPSIDIALFGRMVASDPSLNYDAAAQVAHAISTHTVQNEYDYFTAVDDCAPDDNAGAGHIGTVEFNSSTLYRYATVNVRELYNNVGEDTPLAICGFVEAFIKSMPSGKQNTFANGTLPIMVYVTIRNDQPINLCGAFEKPVRNEGNGFEQPSRETFIQYTQKVYADFADIPEMAFGLGEGTERLGEKLSLSEMIARLKEELEKRIGEI